MIKSHNVLSNITHNVLSNTTHLKSINLIQRRFMVNKRDRDDSEDLSEGNKRLKLENLEKSDNDENMKNVENSESNKNIENVEKSESESISVSVAESEPWKFEKAESGKFEKAESAPGRIEKSEGVVGSPLDVDMRTPSDSEDNRADYELNWSHEMSDINGALERRTDLILEGANPEEIDRNKNYIKTKYIIASNSLNDDDEKLQFDREFAYMAKSSGNRNIVKDITGIDPEDLISESESESESISVSVSESESDNDNSSDNNSSDNDSSENGGIPFNNTPTVENPEENLSGDPSLRNSSNNYSDFFSFVLFQFLNAVSVLLDIIYQIF